MPRLTAHGSRLTAHGSRLTGGGTSGLRLQGGSPGVEGWPSLAVASVEVAGGAGLILTW